MLNSSNSFHRRTSRSWNTNQRVWTWLVVMVSFAIIHDVFFQAQGFLRAEETAHQIESAELPDQATVADREDGRSEDGRSEDGRSEDGRSADGRSADDHGGGHSDPVAPVLLAIVLILFAAKTGGDLFERMSMPAVLGELTVGVLLGNCALLTGWDGLDVFFKIPEATTDLYNTAAILKILASLGVILLLFEVGLESTVQEMMSVGVSSLLVAVLGVVVPFGLGWLVGWYFIPEEGWQVHSFIGATLCATSVGITARVLKDLGKSQQRESKIILGAAVIDDVLGLVVLAVISGIIMQGSVNLPGLLSVIFKAFGFLFGAIVLGSVLFTRPLFKAASFLRGHGMLVSTSLVICFGFSWLANFVGLAPIVGAFAAGLILEKAHYKDLDNQSNHNLEEALAPISTMLVPIFFVQMGSQVDLASFKDPSVWGLSVAITVAAIVGKQVCALGVREKGLNKLAIGLGMIPRGEVGLIFADVGSSLEVNGHKVINKETFSAVVVMVMVTTMVTPPLLKWALTREKETSDDNPPSEDSSA